MRELVVSAANLLYSLSENSDVTGRRSVRPDVPFTDSSGLDDYIRVPTNADMIDLNSVGDNAIHCVPPTSKRFTSIKLDGINLYDENADVSLMR